MSRFRFNSKRTGSCKPLTVVDRVLDPNYSPSENRAIADYHLIRGQAKTLGITEDNLDFSKRYYKNEGQYEKQRLCLALERVMSYKGVLDKTTTSSRRVRGRAAEEAMYQKAVESHMQTSSRQRLSAGIWD
jgi:hypothetical protein